MAQELNEGVAYLRALKQSASPIPATTPAPATDTQATGPIGSGSPVTDSGERFKGAEKRRSPRYKCEGSAEMREVNCDVRTWATFSDISLHGCYVEAQATYPVGAILHMKLEANGFRVETMGNVRMSYPYLGMGIAFEEMSEEDRTRLKELLASISRPSIIMGPGIASAIPSCAPMDAVPLISDPGAAIRALIAFFETRHMLMREDFLMILSKSQSSQSKL